MSTKSTELHNPHNFHVGLKLILENKEGKILALKLPKNSSMAGYYDLPGGRINTEELRTPYEEIIRREVEEEICNDVKYQLILKPVSVSRHIFFSLKFNRESYIFFVFFKALYLDGNIKPLGEHIDYKWIDLNDKTITKYFIKGLNEGLQNYIKWK